MASDVYVTFGGDTAGLEASVATASASVRAYGREVASLANQMQAAGASADSDLGQRMLAAAGNLATARAAVRGLKSELSASGGLSGELAHSGLAAGAITQIGEALRGLSSPIRGVRAQLGEIAEAFAAVYIAGKIVEFARAMGELGEQTERTSEILGVTTQQAGELRYTFAATGTDVANLDQMMGRFEVGLSRPATTTNTVTAGLKALGLSARDLIGVPLPQQLDRIADATAHFADGVNKTAALQSLGRGFVELLPLLDRGAAGMDALRLQADQTGSTLDEVTTGSLAAMQRGFVEMGAALQGAAVAGFTPFIGVVRTSTQFVIDLAEAFTNSAKAAGGALGPLHLIAQIIETIESAVVVLNSGFQVFAVVGDQAAALVDEAFATLGRVVADVFQALSASLPAFFHGLVTAGEESAHAVGQVFVNLGSVISDGLHGDFAGARAAFAGISTDASASAAKISGAFNGVFDFSKVQEDVARFQLAKTMIAQQTADQIVAIGKKEVADLKNIWTAAQPGQPSPSAPGAPQKPQVPALDLSSGKGGKGAKDALAAQMEADQAEIDSFKNTAKQEETILNEKLKTHQITMTQWLAQSQDALNDEKQDIQATYAQELAIAGLSARQIADIKKQEQQALAAIDEQELQDVAKAAEQAAQQWQTATNSINQSFTSQISGLLKGTTTWSQALSNALSELATKVVTFFADWALKAAENFALQIAQNTGIAASFVSMQETMTAAQQTGNIGSILPTLAADAAKVFGGVFAFLAPTLGPGAAAPATAAASLVLGEAAGGGSSYAMGSWQIPNDMLASVHAGEMIVPNNGGVAGEFRNFMSGGGFSGAGGNPVTLNFAPNMSAIDSSGMQGLLTQFAAQISRTVYQHINANPSSFPAW